MSEFLNPPTLSCAASQSFLMASPVCKWLETLVTKSLKRDMVLGQNQWYHYGVGAPPILVYFSGDWDVHWGYGLLTHGNIEFMLTYNPVNS